jgi:hypothetical protein
MGCSSPPLSPFAPVKNIFLTGGNRGNGGAARLAFDFRHRNEEIDEITFTPSQPLLSSKIAMISEKEVLQKNSLW